MVELGGIITGPAFFVSKEKKMTVTKIQVQCFCGGKMIYRVFLKEDEEIILPVIDKETLSDCLKSGKKLDISIVRVTF